MDDNKISFERILTKDNFVKMDHDLKFGVFYDFMVNINDRLNNLEAKIDQRMRNIKIRKVSWAFFGGIIGGFIAVLSSSLFKGSM